jgi:hypothetical protein
MWNFSHFFAKFHVERLSVRIFIKNNYQHVIPDKTTVLLGCEKGKRERKRGEGERRREREEKEKREEGKGEKGEDRERCHSR